MDGSIRGTQNSAHYAVNYFSGKTSIDGKMNFFFSINYRGMIFVLKRNYYLQVKINN